MKKQLDVATITNELRGQSAFFPRPGAEPSAEPKPDTPPSGESEATPLPHRVPPVPPGLAGPLVPPVPLGRGAPRPKRVMKQRHPFDIYVDQYESLRQLALEERKQGSVGSMSAMVRQALDELIARKRAEKK